MRCLRISKAVVEALWDDACLVLWDSVWIFLLLRGYSCDVKWFSNPHLQMWTEPSTGSNFQRPFSPVQLISNAPTWPLVISFRKKKIQFVIQSLVAQTVKNHLQCRRLRFNSWVRKIPWRRKWLPTPVFLPGKSHGQRILVGYRWIESHTTGRLTLSRFWLSKAEGGPETLHFLNFQEHHWPVSLTFRSSRGWLEWQ